MGLMGRIGHRDASRIDGRYRLIERLGTGGMSVVWRAYDEILGRQVAVKVLSAQLAADDSFRDRLRQEALAAARLCHPHLTGIFDFGESSLSEQLTVPYVVMELNDGESVAARLHRQGPLPWRDAVVIAAEVASGLAAAHSLGVVHRDITPANVMLTGAGAKVVDFGISALIGQRDAAPDGSLLGTPAYLAPERLGGSQVRPATDVYALGLLLYRSLTARLPWPAENTTEALRAHLYADPEPLPSLPGLPIGVAELCLRCLAKNPTDRPTAGEVATALAAAAGLPPIAAATRPADFPVRGTASGRLPRPGIASARLPRTGSARLPFRDLRTGGRAVLAARNRTLAVVVTATLLAIMGLTWVSTRESVEVVPLQAAGGARPAAAAPRGSECRVRYLVKRDSGRDFEAQLTLGNTGVHALSGWRLEFAYPGTQRLTTTPQRVAQTGRKVVVSGKSGGRLRPGRSVTVTLRGGYRDANPLPLSFLLNGRACEAMVIGATAMPGTPRRSPVRRVVPACALPSEVSLGLCRMFLWSSRIAAPPDTAPSTPSSRTA